MRVIDAVSTYEMPRSGRYLTTDLGHCLAGFAGVVKVRICSVG